MSQSRSWLLPLHHIVSSHSPAPTGLTAFPLRLSAWLCLTGSVSPLASQHSLLSFPPPLNSDFLFFSPPPSVLPYAAFCTEVQEAVGLHRGDTKMGCPIQRLASVPFTLSSMLLGRGGPNRACLVGMRGALCGARARPDNSGTVLEKAALSSCHCTLHPLSTWEGKRVPPLLCALLAGQNQGEDGGFKAQDQRHPAPPRTVKAGAALQGLGWLCVCQALAGSELGPLLCYRLPGKPQAGPLGHAGAS